MATKNGKIKAYLSLEIMVHIWWYNKKESHCGKVADYKKPYYSGLIGLK